MERVGSQPVTDRLLDEVAELISRVMSCGVRTGWPGTRCRCCGGWTATARRRSSKRPSPAGCPGHRFRVFALAAAAELAVVAGLPDAPRYLDAAAPLAAENGWATACLDRALGRYHHGTDALRKSAAGWERIGAYFERAHTLRLLGD